MNTNRARRILASSLIMIFCCDSLLCAPRQTTNQSQSSEQIKAAVRARGMGEKAKVIVKLRNQTTHKGYISSIGEESFVLMEAATKSSSAIAYVDVIEVKKQGLSKAAKWGIFAVVWIILGIIGNTCV